MNTRIIKIRESLGFTQQEFADRISVAQSTIAGYERGTRIPKPIFVDKLCSEFNVNEEWLRTGEGEMFRFDPDYDETAVYASELLLEKDNPFYDLIIEIMHTYYELDSKSQEVIKNSIVKLVENLKKREG